jgi:hypothetical protein
LYLRFSWLLISGTVNVNCPGYVLGGTHSVSGQFLANEDFTLSAGTLTGTAPLITNKRFYWLGGVLYNLVSGVQCLNGVTIDSAATKQITLTTLNNFAVRSLLLSPSAAAHGYLHSLSLRVAQDAVWLAGSIAGSSATIINSPSSATFTLNFAAPYSFLNAGGQPSVFVNNATFDSIGAGAATLQFAFQNNDNATLRVSGSGLVYFAGGGYNNGTATFGPAATVQLGGVFSLLPNSTFAGSGKAVLSGTVNVDSLFNVSGSTEVSDGQTNFNLDATLANFGNPLTGTRPTLSRFLSVLALGRSL